MKILKDAGNYEVCEANYESLRLALNYIGEHYSPGYFHGIVGTAFRIGGICPCAPTCTMAMTIHEALPLFGYGYEVIPYDDSGSVDDVQRMADAVRASIDRGIPAVVWNAFTFCEWDIVTGYDEGEKVFFGRGSNAAPSGEYAKREWSNPKTAGASTGLMAVIIKDKTGQLDAKAAEIAAVKEAVRHANDQENVDKLGGGEWVFLQGKAAYKRWADNFANPEQTRGLGDAYCLDIYSGSHAQAGGFLREIAPRYPAASEILLKAAGCFDREAECLRALYPYLSWGSPEGPDAERNAKAHPLIKEAAENYGKGVDLLESVIGLM